MSTRVYDKTERRSMYQNVHSSLLASCITLISLLLGNKLHVCKQLVKCWLKLANVQRCSERSKLCYSRETVFSADNNKPMIFTKSQNSSAAKKWRRKPRIPRPNVNTIKQADKSVQSTGRLPQYDNGVQQVVETIKRTKTNGKCVNESRHMHQQYTASSVLFNFNPHQSSLSTVLRPVLRYHYSRQTVD